MAIRLCTRYTPSTSKQRGGEERRPLGREHAQRQQQEHGREQDAGECGREPEAPRLVAEDEHTPGDQQLRERRVHPLGGRLAAQVLQRRLRVVHLVEVLLGRVAEAGEPDERGDERHQQQQACRPAHGAAPRAGALLAGCGLKSGSARRTGTANELPPKRESTA